MASLSHQLAHNHYRHNYHTGYYNDYNYRPDKYGKVTNGKVCQNNLEFEGGIVFGEFICPIEGFNLDETMCCGAPNEQYCCSLKEYRDTPLQSSGSSSSTAFFIIFFLVLLVSIGLCTICVCYLRKKTQTSTEL